MKNKIIKRVVSWFDDLTIKRKLWITQFFSMGILLFFIILIISIHEFYSSRKQLLYDTQAMAYILGENYSAALVFKDQKNAEELLQSLRFNHSIVLAYIYLSDGQIFASYHKNDIKDGIKFTTNDFGILNEPIPDDIASAISSVFHVTKGFSKPLLNIPAHSFDWRGLELFQPIYLPDQSTAIIRFRVSFDLLYDRLLQFIGVVTLISLIIFSVAMLVMDRLQYIITRPLLELTDLMHVISRKRDYTYRITVTRCDEIGLLAQNFNSMLDVIEQHQEGLNRELHERSKAEQELYLAHLELHEHHRQIESAYQELARTRDQLIHSEKMASLGLLVAGVAHELNNPISYVYSNLEFIEEYTESLIRIIDVYSGSGLADIPVLRCGDDHVNTINIDKNVKVLRELIASSREGAERVKKVVLDLKGFSRTDDIGCMPTQLHEGIESTLKFLTKQFCEYITIHRDYGNLPFVECHPSQINQVFMNLLQNAAESIQNKGDIWIRTESNSEWVKIVIKDNGIGIDQDSLTRIFDPFYTTKPFGKGTGLGLSISYGIIKDHGGTIQVGSKINQGTEFTIQLPIRCPMVN